MSRWCMDSPSGMRIPVALGEDGRGIKPRDYAVYREGVVVSAESGWYAVIRYDIHSDAEADIDRMSIVAWELADWGDAYVVVSDADDESPVITRLGFHVDSIRNAHLGGIFHPVHRPEVS